MKCRALLAATGTAAVGLPGWLRRSSNAPDAGWSHDVGGRVDAGRLLALDPATGDRLWQFGDDDSSVRSAAALDGVAYVSDGAAVRAIQDGEGRWGTGSTFESHPRVAVDDGRLFVRAGTGLLRFDPGDGSKRWSVDVDHLNAWTVHGDRVYAAGTELFAFDADDGAERWSESVADGPLDRVQVAADAGGADGADHAVFVEEEDEAILRVSPGGEVTWSEQVTGDVRSYVVDDLVYVGTDGGIYASDPR